jgi:hypothetical protein
LLNASKKFCQSFVNTRKMPERKFDEPYRPCQRR